MKKKYTRVNKDDIDSIQNLENHNDPVIADSNDKNQVCPANPIIIDHSNQNQIEQHYLPRRKTNINNVLYYFEVVSVLVIVVVIISCPVVDIIVSQSKVDCHRTIYNSTSNMTNIINFVEYSTENIVMDKLLLYGVVSLGTLCVYFLYCCIIASRESETFHMFKCFYTIRFYKISLIFVNAVGFVCSITSCLIFHQITNFLDSCENYNISVKFVMLSMYVLLILNIFATIICGAFLVVATYKILQIIIKYIKNKCVIKN